MKKIFFDLLNLQNHKNVKINLHDPAEKETVFQFKKTNVENESASTGQYSNILKDKNGLHLYYRIDRKMESCTGYAHAKDDKHQFARSVSNKPNIILNDPGTCHNFFVFYDDNPECPSDEKYKAFGGIHNGPPNNKLLDEKCFRLPDTVWPSEEKFVYDPFKFRIGKKNGLYVFKSKDGRDWKLYNDRPVLNSLVKPLDAPLGSLAFDTMPMGFYDERISKYVLYVRCNYKLDVRHVLYTTSEDLINWEVPRLISTSPDFDLEHDNFYYSGVYKYPNSDYYIAFPPCFKAKQPGRVTYDAGAKLMFSRDRINWTVVGKIFEHSGRYGHDVAGFCASDDQEKLCIYVHKDYLKQNNRIVKYDIDVDKLTSITNVDDEEGSFTLHMPDYRKDLLKLNYLTHKNGYVKINFVDMHHIEIKIKDADLYSIEY